MYLFIAIIIIFGVHASNLHYSIFIIYEKVEKLMESWHITQSTYGHIFVRVRKTLILLFGYLIMCICIYIYVCVLLKSIYTNGSQIVFVETSIPTLILKNGLYSDSAVLHITTIYSLLHPNVHTYFFQYPVLKPMTLNKKEKVPIFTLLFSQSGTQTISTFETF